MIFVYNYGTPLTAAQAAALNSFVALATTPAGNHLAKDSNGEFVNTPDTGGGGGSPGGSDTQVQFNDSGSFGGDSALTWDKIDNILTVDGLVIDGPAISTADGASPLDITITGGADTSGNGEGADITITAGASNGTTGGGDMTLNAGEGGATGGGGNIFMYGGTGGATSGGGGGIELRAGDAQTDGQGGNFSFGAGNAAGDNDGGSFEMGGGNGSGTGEGGQVVIQGGEGGATDGAGGNVIIIPGPKGGAGIDGQFAIQDPSSNLAAFLNTASLTSADKMFTFPNATGVFVLETNTATLTNKTLTSPVLTTPSAFTTGGTITLAENTSIALDPAGSADGKYTGITVTGTAGYTQAFGDLVYLAVADSRWELADADAASTAGPVALAMVVVAGTDGNPCTLLLQGIIRADSKFPTMTVGATQYVGETAGAIQGSIPTGADNIIRTVGYALTADELYFNPSTDWQVTVA